MKRKGQWLDRGPAALAEMSQERRQEEEDEEGSWGNVLKWQVKRAERKRRGWVRREGEGRKGRGLERRVREDGRKEEVNSVERVVCMGSFSYTIKVVEDT